MFDETILTEEKEAIENYFADDDTETDKKIVKQRSVPERRKNDYLEKKRAKQIAQQDNSSYFIAKNKQFATRSHISNLNVSLKKQGNKKIRQEKVEEDSTTTKGNGYRKKLSIQL